MNRRQAMTIIAGAAGAYQQSTVRVTQNGLTGDAHVLSAAMPVTLVLADEEDAKRHGGITQITVLYKSSGITFTAKEIWEALHDRTS